MSCFLELHQGLLFDFRWPAVSQEHEPAQASILVGYLDNEIVLPHRNKTAIRRRWLTRYPDAAIPALSTSARIRCQIDSGRPAGGHRFTIEPFTLYASRVTRWTDYQ